MELFVNNLTVIDFSYLDASRGFVGESLIVDIRLKGELDEKSMVMDFSKVKSKIKKHLDATIDHALVVPLNSHQISYYKHGMTAEVTLHTNEGEVDCYVSGPVQSFYPIDEVSFNKETLEKSINESLEAIFPGNVSNVEVSLREEHVGGYFYHYAHALKKHTGNCQRIAHGHRSAIRIFIDNERSASWEMFWAERWRDCYLMSEDDIVDVTKLSASAQNIASEKLIASGYTSGQGRFELLIRHERVEILPHDTTIERIARYINQEIRYLQPELVNVAVHAYEGIEKGAIV